MEEHRTVARNLKKMREASGFTQEKIADYLGIKRSAYANYEVGDREFPLSVLESLADLYGCDMYMLYEGDSDVVGNMLATAFRVNDLSAEDMVQIADFKRMVKNYLKMDILLKK